MRQSVYGDTNTGRYFVAMVAFVLSVIVNAGISSAQTNIQLQAKNDTVNALSVYEYRFTTADSLYNDAEIRLSFPEAFSTANVKLAHSSDANGGIKVTVVNREIVLRRAGIGKTVPPGTAVSIQFANMKNPDTADNYAVGMRMKRTASAAEVNQSLIVTISE
jgi:hypothetical protein